MHICLGLSLASFASMPKAIGIIESTIVNTKASEFDSSKNRCISEYEQQLYFYKVRVSADTQKARELGFANPLQIAGDPIEAQWILKIEAKYGETPDYHKFFSSDFTTPKQPYGEFDDLEILDESIFTLWNEPNAMSDPNGFEKVREDHYSFYFTTGYRWGAIHPGWSHDFFNSGGKHFDIWYEGSSLKSKTLVASEKVETPETQTYVVVSPLPPEKMKLQISLTREYPVSVFRSFGVSQEYTQESLSSPEYELPFYDLEVSYETPAKLQKVVEHVCPMASLAEELAQKYNCPEFANNPFVQMSNDELVREMMYKIVRANERNFDLRVFDVLEDAEMTERQYHNLIYCLSNTDFWEAERKYGDKIDGYGSSGGVVYKCSKFTGLKRDLVELYSDLFRYTTFNLKDDRRFRTMVLSGNCPVPLN